MTKRKLRYSGLGLAVLTVGVLAACSSSDNNTPAGGGGSGPTAGTHSGGAGPGTGGSTPGTAGTNAGGMSTGGSATGGTGTGGTAGFACTNTMPACAVITDGTNLVADTSRPGDFKVSGAVEGGTYTYAANALTLDSVGSSALNVKGNVKTYDGVGFYFNTCYDVKTLGYTGVSFSIKGNAGPTGMVGFRVQTNSNTAIDAMNKKGTCVATNPSDPYPDCHAAEKQIAVTSSPTVITVNFADLTGGLPTAGVNGADVVGLEWALAWKTGGFGAGGTGAGGAAAGGSSAGGASGSGGASGGSAGKGGGTAAGGTSAGGSAAGGAAPSDGSYNVDFTIDDVKFIGGPATPAVCPAGTGGSGAGGSSAGGASAGGSSPGGSSSGGASAGTGGASAGSGGHAGG